MTATEVNITTPVGRIVQGSLYEPQTKDWQGNALVIKTGPNAGQPTSRIYFALAIPKKPGETHWAMTEWGKSIWAVGHAAFPQAAQRQDFSWKMDDGDSQIPNKANRRPCDQEGFPGNWILRLSSSFAPKIYNADGSAPILEKGAVKCGFFVQVNLNVAGNKQQTNSGVYLNATMVALSGYGEEIMQGPDPASAGFGGQALPPGASATPVASFVAPAAVQQPAAPAPVAPAPAPVAVAPHQTILTPQAPPPPPAPAAPAAPPRRTMTAAATGTYEAYIASGWNDAQLIQHGLMTP